MSCDFHERLQPETQQAIYQSLKSKSSECFFDESEIFLSLSFICPLVDMKLAFNNEIK